jgi:hypothetical protein
MFSLIWTELAQEHQSELLSTAAHERLVREALRSCPPESADTSIWSQLRTLGRRTPVVRRLSALGNRTA